MEHRTVSSNTGIHAGTGMQSLKTLGKVTAMDYLLTGGTGLIGSHILFELLKDKLSGGSVDRIYLLLRAKGTQSATERLEQMLGSTLVPDYLHGYELITLQNAIEPVFSDLSAPDLRQKLEKLPLQSTTVIHAAASTNLLQGVSAAEEVYINNTQGTFNLIQATSGCIKFVYISTAFSCGIRSGTIGDRITHEPDTRYRNPYEKNKSVTELKIREFAKSTTTRFQILRPSVVCGRLHDTQLYVTPKFDVFYGITRFFSAYRQVMDSEGIRIWINPEGTLNIVPADYVAKAVIGALAHDDLTEMNIVHARPPLHSLCFTEIAAETGVGNFQFVATMPTKLNRIEKFYYKTVGSAFNPYITTPKITFDVTLTDSIAPVKQAEVIPNFRKLLRYAVTNNFEEGFKNRMLSEHFSLQDSPVTPNFPGTIH